MTSSRLVGVGWALVFGSFTLNCGGSDDATPPGPQADGSAGTSSADDAGGGSAATAASGGAAASAGASGSAGGSGTGGAGGIVDGGGADTGSDAGASTAPPDCVKTCRVAADCARDGANPPFDGNNWACDNGGYCRWLGCLEDAECAFFNGVCRLRYLSSVNVKTCTEGCTDVMECVETLVSVDLDNWSCADGGCKYTGCKSDAECAADHGAGAKCLPGDPYPSCRRPCTQPADCVTMGALPHQDADNWVCRDNICVYAGCTSDQECTEAERLPAVCLRR